MKQRVTLFHTQVAESHQLPGPVPHIDLQTNPNRLLTRLAVVFLLVLCLMSLIGVLWAVPALQAAGTVRYVSINTGSDSANTCSVFYNPCKTIQRALDSAAEGDEIRVAAGRYPESNVSVSISVTLQGGYTTTDWLVPQPNQNITIIDAQTSGRVIVIDNPTTVDVVIRGFRLTGGRVTNGAGAGVFNRNSTLLLENNNIYGNQVTVVSTGIHGGGGVGTGGGATTILVRNRIYNNIVVASAGSGLGGGVSIVGGSAMLEANEVFSNSASTGGGGVVVFETDAEVTLKNNLIYTNTAVDYGGGGVDIEDGTVILLNNTLYDNAGANGGALYAFTGTVRITNSLIISNNSPVGGGIFLDQPLSGDPTLTVDDTDFFGNATNDIEGNVSIGIGAVGSGNNNRNPLFRFDTPFDLNLSSGSPARDDGATVALTSDYEGEGRPFGAAFDRGADEFTDRVANTCFARLNDGPVYTDIQDAVDAASSVNDVVKVAGVCTGVNNRGGTNQTVYLSKTLTLRGGYTVTNWSTVGEHASVVDADSSGRGLVISHTAAINPVVENLHITGGSVATGAGVYLGNNANVVLRNNVIHNNAASSGGGGVYHSGGGDVDLLYNTIVENSAPVGSGVLVSDETGPGQATLNSNIVAKNINGTGIYATSGSRFGLSYNNVYNPTTTNYGGVAVTGTTDISLDPILTTDYHLPLASPMINAADPDGVLSSDFEGDTRPIPADDLRDIGADESRVYAQIVLGDAPESPQIITSLSQDTPVTFTHIITHLGNTGAVEETVDITISNTQGWAVDRAVFSQTLQLGQPVEFSIVITIPAGAELSGLFNTVFVTATSTSNVGAKDVVTNIIANPGLQFAASESAFGDPGEVITYTHTLTNIGPTDTFSITYETNRNWFAVNPVVPTQVSLAHNGTAQIIARVRITDTAPVGIFDVMTVTVTSLNYGGFGVTGFVTNTTTANASSGPRYVANSGADAENNCKSKDQPCATIPYAVGQAADEDDIYVQQGMYELTGTLLIQNNSLHAGRSAPNFSRPGDVNPADTVVQKAASAPGNFPGIRILPSPAYQQVLEDFALQGFANPNASGGGILVSGSADPILRNIQVEDTTGQDGGGIYIDAGAPTLSDITIINTEARNKGGGLYVGSGSPVIERLTITGSQVTAGSQYGGGIYIGSGSVIAEQLYVTRTQAISGAGIFVDQGGTLTVVDGGVSDSTATTGGGLFLNAGQLVGTSLNLLNNDASSAGGGVFQVGGTLQITQSRIALNTAPSGGAIYGGGGLLTLWNNFVYSNTATLNGGAIYKAAGQLDSTNNTFYGNQAGNLGGAVFDDQSSRLAITNTIFLQNQAADGGGIYRLSSGDLAVDYNLFWQNQATAGSNPQHNLVSAGSNSFEADPLLEDPPTGNLYLRLDSPAVDQADPDTFLTLDIEDDIRPIDQGYDIGADELAGCLARVVDSDGDLKPGLGDKRFGVIQEAVAAASNSDVIQIHGTCRGVNSRDVGGNVLSQVVFVNKSLTLEGGYDSNFAGNSPPQPTVLDAQGAGRVLYVSETDSGSTVSVNVLLLTLANGDAAGLGGGPADADAGGGVFNQDNILTLRRVVITNSTAARGGGVYHNNSVGGTLLNMGGSGETVIISNTASYGGGVYVAGIGEPSIAEVTISRNYAGSGGGLYVAGGMPTVEDNSLISENSVSGQGGGVFVASGAMLAISETTLFSNTAASGGAVYNSGQSDGVRLTVSGNKADAGGGVYNQSGGDFALARSYVYTNSADGSGGGVYAAAGTVTLINNLVYSNGATVNGGGLYNTTAELTVRHNTFYQNRAGNRGAGIYHDANSTTPVINSTMLVENSATNEGGGIYAVAQPNKPAFDYNNVVNNTGSAGSENYGGGLADTDGSGNISVAPIFVSTDPGSDKFLRITGGSGGEELGDPASPVNVDIDLDPRPSNQNFDIGADEVGDCYVRVNGDPPTYGKVQMAVGVAQPGDEIRIAGTCPGVSAFMDGGQVVTQSVFLTKSLILKGGYRKDNFQNQSLTGNPPTILDALNDYGRVLYITNSARITVNGLHIVGGNGVAAGGADGGNGGAVFVGNGDVDMSQNRIYSNTATYGGGVYVLSGTVRLVEETYDPMYGIFTNTATTAGGALYNAGGDLTVDRLELRNNRVTSGDGGALYHSGGTTLLRNNILWQNSAANGAAIYNNAAGLTVWHNTAYNNSATNTANGLYNASAVLPDVRNNIFFDDNDGAVMIHSDVAYSVPFNDVVPANYVGATAGTGALSVDPAFGNPASGVFTLPETSPVLDKGDPTMEIFQDFEADYRPGDQNFDMGADEWASCWAKVASSGIIYGNLQLAIYNSVPGDTILVSRGVCRGVHPYVDVGSGRTFSQTVHITHNLTIKGGYNRSFTDQVEGPTGYPDTTASTLDPRDLQTGAKLGRAILVTDAVALNIERFNVVFGDATGLGGGPANDDAGGGIYFAPGVNATISMIDSYSNTAAYGGAIYNAGDRLTMRNNWMRYNNADQDGGAVYNDGGQLTITENTENEPSEIRDSQAGNRGGAVFNARGRVVISQNNNDRLRGNRANQGGLLYNDEATAVMTLTNNVILTNASVAEGGAIYNNAGRLYLSGNSIYENAASAGGAIYNDNGMVTLGSNNKLYQNTVGTNEGNQGGAIYNNADGSLALDYGNRLYENEAHQGGAIYHEGSGSGSLNMYNTFVYKNRAEDRGGAIYLNDGAPEIIHNTFYRNTASALTAFGGALFIGNGSPLVKNNIFDRNVAAFGSAIRVDGGTPTLAYNDYYVDGGAIQVSPPGNEGTNNLNAPPEFVDEAAFNFALSSSSPLIDEGEDGLGVDHDYSGDPRPINLAPDIGADEVNACLVQVVSAGASDNSGDINDGPIFGRIQDALDDPATGEGKKLRVAAGTCIESIVIDEKVPIDGSWEKDFSQPVKVDGIRVIATTVNAIGQDRVVRVESSAEKATLSYLILKNGVVNGAGGGIWSNANLDLNYVTVSDSQGTIGGGVYIPDKPTDEDALSANMTAVTLDGNKATSGSGGGLYLGQEQSLSFSGVVDGNSAPVGGGIYLADDTEATLSAVFNSNQATGGNGGGLYVGLNSSVDAASSSYFGNSADNYGGAMYNAPGSDYFTTGGSPIQSNNAAVGGSVYINNATFELTNKRISNSQANTGDGGGMYVTGSNSAITMTNPGFYNNEAADQGGGIYLGNGQLRMYHGTVHYNDALGGEGGGFYVNNGADMIISASIVASNTAVSGGTGLHSNSGNVTIVRTLRWNNDFGGSGISTSNMPPAADPLFLDTPFGLLSYNSPAIDNVPPITSTVSVDATLDDRPLLCAKDLGRDEYAVGKRAFNTGGFTPAGSTLNPTEAVSYTFTIRNDSENWGINDDENSSLGVGTGYTETVRITLNSSRGWAKLLAIQNAVNVMTYTGTSTATFDLGPGERATIVVMVTVPPGTLAGIDEITRISYQTLQCAGYKGNQTSVSGQSDAATTKVRENFDFVVEPDNSGAALPGETITYTHIITNIGNKTDTYFVFPKAGFYASGQVTTPAAPHEITLAPNEAYTIYMRVTVREEAAGGLQDTTFAVAESQNTSIQKGAANSTDIGYTSGTRHVSVEGGADSLVSESQLGAPEDLDDNNCTLPGGVQPCRTIAHAIAQAAPGDLIKIATGTYTETISLLYGGNLITQSIFITKPVSLAGGYLTTNWNQEPPDHFDHPTIIDPLGAGRGIFVGERIGASPLLTLSTLAVTGGQAENGANIYSEGGNLVLNALRVYNGNASGNGGGLYSTGSEVLIQNSLFHGNQATTNRRCSGVVDRHGCAA
jgi:hypothetical protein